MDAGASTPDPDGIDRTRASAMVDHDTAPSLRVLAEAIEESGSQQVQPPHQIGQSEEEHTFSFTVDQQTSQMDVDQQPVPLPTVASPNNHSAPAPETNSVDRISGGDVVALSISAIPENSNKTESNMVASHLPTDQAEVKQGTSTPENSVAAKLDSLDQVNAVIYDVTETPTVPMPNFPSDEQLSPLHRMAEIALATSPIMSNGTLNRGDGTMVLPSQQYYESGSSLFVPLSLSARERYEIDASRALGKTESTPVFSSSYPPSTSHSDPHPFGYATGLQSLHPAVNGKRRSSADDSAGHRYTHSRLQPKNKSPPSFHVVQLRGGTSEDAGGGAQQPSSAFSKPESKPREMSPPNNQMYLDRPSNHTHAYESWQGHDHHSYTERPDQPHASYTDPIPHAQIHTYQPPVSYSNTTSPVMNDRAMLPPPQPQNRLSIYDLVLAAEASARENDYEQQATGTSMTMESISNDQPSPLVESQTEANTSASSEKKPKHRKNSKKKTSPDVKSPGEQPINPGNMDPPSVPSKSHKKKERDASSSMSKIDAGIVGHIPVRENSRSISKLLWAENGGGKVSSTPDVDAAIDQALADDEDDILPEESDVDMMSRGKVEMGDDTASKGKKRQSNGAIKPPSSTANGKSHAAKGKGKKKAEEPLPMEGIEEEEVIQPKKKGKKNESASKSKGKGVSNSHAKNRAGSLESSVTADKKAGKGSKQKSVQIDEEPEFFKRSSSRKGRGKNQAASPEPTIEEEEEEDTTLYCVCKKAFSEDSSTMVECDVCQNWYHIHCVGVAEEDIGLLDQYVCPVCDKDPGVTLKTCYKDKCQREGCRRPGRGALSKFCSETCGIHYALGRLKTNKVKPSQVAKSLSTVIQPEGIALSVSSKFTDQQNTQTDVQAAVEDILPKVESELVEVSKPFQDRTARARQARALDNAESRNMFEQRKQSIERDIEQLARQESFLKRAIENAESLLDLQADDAEEQRDADALAVAEAARNKKKKSKKSKSSAAEKAVEERPCGFDMRFVNDGGLDERNADQDADQQDAAMRNGDEQADDTVCLLPRKRCERHVGWQKLRTADLDLLRSNLTQQLEQVNKLLETCDAQPGAEPILVNGNA